MTPARVVHESQNFELLYTEIVQKINSLLNDSNDELIKKAVLKNVEEIRTWLPKETKNFDPKKRLHLPALNALQATLVILNAIEALSEQNQYKSHSKSLISHLFTGAHVRIEDDGAFLDNLNKHMSLFKRFSSHYKNEKIAKYVAQHKNEQNQATIEQEALDDFNKGTPDYSVRAELIFNELVMGKVTREGKTYTWLQFEGHSHQPRSAYRNSLVQLLDGFLQLFHYSIEKFQHHLDYVNYRFHGKKQNIGQYGNSEFTESNSIVLDESTEPDPKPPGVNKTI